MDRLSENLFIIRNWFYLQLLCNCIKAVSRCSAADLASLIAAAYDSQRSAKI